MKKIIVFFSVIIIFYIVFNFLASKHSSLIQYKVNDFSIIEDSNKYFQIEGNGLKFDFQVSSDIEKKAVKEIKYYSDNEYKCIMPIFKGNKIYTDVMCLKDDIQYLYNTMENKNEGLINFRNNLYRNEITDEADNLGIMKLYKNSLVEGKYIIINSYKEIYILSKNTIKEIKLFDKDIYNQTIKSLVGKYYIIADYNQEHDFSNFYIIDVESGKKKVLKTNYEISFDSIIQGNYDNKLYLYDIDNKNQYEINPNSMSLKIIGNEKKGIKIFNEDFKTYKYSEISDFRFKYLSEVNGKKILDFNVPNSSYYYLLNNKIYRANINNVSKLTYLFTNNYDTIKYSKDYLCMINNDTLYCYHELLGIKKVIINSEFVFNKNLTYEIYSK